MIQKLFVKEEIPVKFSIRNSTISFNIPRGVILYINRDNNTIEVRSRFNEESVFIVSHFYGAVIPYNEQIKTILNKAVDAKKIRIHD
jgi:hypothetical protein